VRGPYKLPSFESVVLRIVQLGEEGSLEKGLRMLRQKHGDGLSVDDLQMEQ